MGLAAGGTPARNRPSHNGRSLLRWRNELRLDRRKEERDGIRDGEDPEDDPHEPHEPGDRVAEVGELAAVLVGSGGIVVHRQRGSVEGTGTGWSVGNSPARSRGVELPFVLEHVAAGLVDVAEGSLGGGPQEQAQEAGGGEEVVDDGGQRERAFVVSLEDHEQVEELVREPEDGRDQDQEGEEPEPARLRREVTH